MPEARAVVTCAVGDVTHFPHLIATHLHLLTQLTCNSAAALSHHVPQSRLSRILRAARCTLRTRTALHSRSSLRIVTFLLSLYQHAPNFAPV